MKNVLLVLVLLLSLNTIGQVKVNGSIELGQRSLSAYIWKEKLTLASYKTPKNMLYTDVNLKFTWRFIKVENLFCNNFTMSSLSIYVPVDIEYLTKISLTHKRFSIGYNHSCLHPVISTYKEIMSEYRRGGEDSFFIKFEW
jgi:hypothetical protein